MPKPARDLTLPVTLLIQAASAAAVLAPATAAPRLLAALGLGAGAVGVYVATVYFAAMVSSQWSAALVGRLGPVRTSQLSLAAAALGLLLVAVPQTAVAWTGAVLIGAGYGPIGPAGSDMLARSTPPERYALVFSVKQTGVPLGGALAGLLVPLAIELAGGAASQLQMALLCGGAAALGQSLRATHDARRDASRPWPRVGQLAAPLRFVWSHPVRRQVALCSLVFSAVQVCVSGYLVSWLHRDLAWTLVAAGVALTVAQVAGVAGRVVWGLAADRWRAPRGVLLALALSMLLAGLACAALTPATPRALVLALAAFYGATAVGWNGVYLATIARLAPVDSAALATAGSLFLTYAGVVLIPPVFGWIGEVSGHIGTAYAALAVPLAWTLWALARGDWDEAAQGGDPAGDARRTAPRRAPTRR